MKKILTVSVIALLLQGCALFQGNKITPYDAGFALVMIDQGFKPFIPQEYQRVADSAFALLTIDYNQPGGLLDAYVEEQINALYADSTPEFRLAMFNLYKLAKVRVRLEISQNPNLPKIEIIDQFKAGVRDALNAVTPKG